MVNIVKNAQVVTFSAAADGACLISEWGEKRNGPYPDDFPTAVWKTFCTLNTIFAVALATAHGIEAAN
jgi:hypothetical protein